VRFSASRKRVSRIVVAPLVAAALVLPTAASVAPAATAARSKPNIVFIITDDQRSDQLGHMPILRRRLIGKGVHFANAFVSDPLCCPSRASILRGQYAHSTGVYDNGGPYGGWKRVRSLNLERSTLATWLSSAGYQTGLVGKYFNGYNQMSYVPPGWSTWRAKWQANYFGYEMSIDGATKTFGTAPADYDTTVMTRYANRFIRGADPSRPLFLYLAYHAPHSPYTPAPDQVDAPACRGESNTDAPSFNEDTSDKPAYMAALRPMSPAEQHRVGVTNWVHSCETLLSVDQGIGTVLNALRATGRLGNTMIVYIGDNGLAFGEHRDRTGKSVPYEDSIRVPMVIRYDPLTHRGGTTDRHLVLNIDLAPTVADLLRLDVSIACTTPPWGGVCKHGFDGRSLLPLLRAHSPARFTRRRFLIEHYDDVPGPGGIPTYCGLRTTRYMYTRYVDKEQELYDLRTDPNELTNLLYRTPAPAVSTIRRHLLTRLKRLCSPAPPGYSFG
jgi:N-acetylglucosamine-6-sulfatase